MSNHKVSAYQITISIQTLLFVVLANSTSATARCDCSLASLTIQLIVIPGEALPLVDGSIEPSKPPDQIRQEAYPLPNDFEWSTLDISDPIQVRNSWLTTRNANISSLFSVRKSTISSP